MAAASAVSFAQTDVTSKLLNSDMEKGVLGWDIAFDGSDIWKKTTRLTSPVIMVCITPASRYGSLMLSL